MYSQNDLYKISDTLTNITNAIASVINVDVTIVDEKLNRIAGTGKYLDNIGEKLNDNCLFAYALKQNESFIIENPREHEACKNCTHKGVCREWAQVCCPIKINRDTIGIIGLIAFNKEQKEIISSNKMNLLEFLNHMADLIASKLDENRKKEEITLMASELEILLNSMNTGVISTGQNGEIKRCNIIANEMFELNKIKNIKEIIKNKFSNKKSPISNKEFVYKYKNKNYRAFYSVKPIIIENEVTGYIFTFTKMKEILKVVNDLSSPTQMTFFSDIIGESINIKDVKRYAKKISKSNSTVLITGESGTGKELFARSIHFESERADKPFIAINCTAIPENLIETELFGYEEGAFTGAKKSGKLGKFELAHKGTIFLDEIGDMPLHLQTKLLRVLQESVIERVGGNSVIPVDVRVIAATNKLLEQKVKYKEFREDLYYRLNVIPLKIPPLRERLDDITILVDNFLEKFNKRLNRNINKVSNNVIELFRQYHWPGNIRELENVIEYAVNMCVTDIINIGDLPRNIREQEYENIKENTSSIMTIKELEKIEIKKALDRYGRDNKGIEKSARVLGIGRATIYRKIKSYNI
ncbi:sigma-54-dependent Fis family transcriptional regulator [Senegalia massiliensis]|uniref:sigma-54-dependent Fis family transcriptional regulator n=1 Tax=Senegalia massiliensis TaxID=1720316 RepID=UPI0010308AB8|nr:sigma 54-interacting transcriptional regulator [Senegalia massiliensis]